MSMYAIQNPSEHIHSDSFAHIRIIKASSGGDNQSTHLLFSVSRLIEYHSQDSCSQRLDWHLQSWLIRCPRQICSKTSRPLLGLALPQASCWHYTPRIVDGATEKRRAGLQASRTASEARSYHQIYHGCRSVPPPHPPDGYPFRTVEASYLLVHPHPLLRELQDSCRAPPVRRDTSEGSRLGDLRLIGSEIGVVETTKQEQYMAVGRVRVRFRRGGRHRLLRGFLSEVVG